MGYFPTRGRLIGAWGALMIATLATATFGRAGVPGPLGPLFLVLLALVTWAKAGVILRIYLNLRTVPVWADALMLLVGIALAIVLAFFALGAAR